MATCGIWKIETRLDHVIHYITNPEKTHNSDYAKEMYSSLHNTSEYLNSDCKIEKQNYVSGINCLPDTALQEMNITKREFGKTGGILGFHSFQSFKEGEVTPDQAHAIGIRLAEEMWGDRFEVVVATHSNTNHIHNHFVINSVSFKDGKKYYDGHETYAQLRNLNDAICSELGLSVLEEKTCSNSNINYTNFFTHSIKKSNYHTIAKQDVDRAIALATDIKDFENLLNAMGYEIVYRYNKISIKKYPYRQNIRIERNFGEEYSIENIKKRIEITFISELDNVDYKNDKPKSYFLEFLKPKKGSIYKLYLHYCYLLKVFPLKSKKISASVRANMKDLEDISNQIILLNENEINSYENLLSYKNRTSKKLDVLLDKRSKLWSDHKKAKSHIEKKRIRISIDELSEQIKPIENNVRLCKELEETIPLVEDRSYEIDIKNNERRND